MCTIRLKYIRLGFCASFSTSFKILMCQLHVYYPPNNNIHSALAHSWSIPTRIEALYWIEIQKHEIYVYGDKGWIFTMPHSLCNYFPFIGYSTILYFKNKGKKIQLNKEKQFKSSSVIQHNWLFALSSSSAINLFIITSNRSNKTNINNEHGACTLNWVGSSIWSLAKSSLRL